MIQLKCNIDSNGIDLFEDYLYELAASPWAIVQDDLNAPHHISGYFKSHIEAFEAWQKLLNTFPELPDNPPTDEIEDRDWKEAYKMHFKPFEIDGFHWVPIWERDTYVVPDYHQAIYVEPGMAFGTGTHPSTRMCLEVLIWCRNQWRHELSTKTLIDAGCGTGVLALSAAKMGFQNIYAFDHDQIAVDKSVENSAYNNLNNMIQFEQAEVNDALNQHKGDLILANILSSIVCAHAKNFLTALNPQGVLILSGLLDHELAETLNHFRQTAETLGMTINIKDQFRSGWAALIVKMPG